MISSPKLDFYLFTPLFTFPLDPLTPPHPLSPPTMQARAARQVQITLGRRALSTTHVLRDQVVATTPVGTVGTIPKRSGGFRYVPLRLPLEARGCNMCGYGTDKLIHCFLWLAEAGESDTPFPGTEANSSILGFVRPILGRSIIARLISSSSVSPSPRACPSTTCSRRPRLPADSSSPRSRSSSRAPERFVRAVHSLLPLDGSTYIRGHSPLTHR